MKRAAEVEDVSGTKRSKPDDPEGSWACKYCGNVNWPQRTTCNKRGCHMPQDSGEVEHPEGSWACSGCANVNWPKRTKCNKCNMPRPGAGAMPAGFGGQGGGGAGNAPGLADAQPGSWACPLCANINWPMRTTCNKKSCGAPKPANAGTMMPADPMAAYYQGMAGGINPEFYGAHGLPGMGQMGGQMGGHMAGLLGNPYAMAGMGPMGMGQMGGGASSDPVGSWACGVCNNINWPKRTTCNRSGCDAPRAAGQGQGAGAAGAAQADPEGSWACPTCANINWPQRTSCNKAGCDTPKPM